MLKVVNMIPNNWSDEENQDSEPNLSVNHANPHQIVGTAFTYDNPAGTSVFPPAMSANSAPIFYSTDGGDTWSLEFVIPSLAGASFPTLDITTRYGGTTGEVYSGFISVAGVGIIVARAPNATTPQVQIANVQGDQPFVEATTSAGQDRLYVGFNQTPGGAPTALNSTALVFLDANGAAPTFTNNQLDVRFPADMPPTRTAIHKSGTIYCAFYSYNGPLVGGFPDSTTKRNVVVVKDLNWGASVPPFQALKDSSDLKVGVRVALDISNPWFSSNFLDPGFGNDRFGPELAIAVDPNDEKRVYIAYATGTGNADFDLHLQYSDDGGQTWQPDVRTVFKAKNPSIAINSLGMVGFAYQQVVGPNWVSVFEVSDNGFISGFTTHVLSVTPTDAPPQPPVNSPYLGDYIKLLANGKDFYGTFCASNAPVKANFPSGVIYQRNVNWGTQTLLANDGVTPVAPSIDPFFFKLSVGTPSVATAIPNNGFFGSICLGSFADETLTINNRGAGTLWISNITSTSIDFEPPGVLSYPLEVLAGTSIDVTIRFRPTTHGPHAGQIKIFSNDPKSPHVIDVSGDCPAPHLSLMIANKGFFGKCCKGSFADEWLVLNNSSRCRLSVSSITSSAADFVVPEVITYPLTVGPGDSLPVPIRFSPTAFGFHAATITVISNDPASPATIRVSGEAPSGKLAVTGSTHFGGVTACCCADRTISICNVGDCALHVTSVNFKHKSRHWKLINNPFPAWLRPGSCLAVVIQYHANERCGRLAELVIESDDPDTPVKTLELLAYTIWDGGYKCDDCAKGCCKKQGHCPQGYECCCEDEEEHH
jgi:BNR/Asp-box repeat